MPHAATLASRIVGLMGKHPRMAALLSGLFAACGFPPLMLWPLTILALAGLVWLVHISPGWREALLRGWLFGFAHYTLANSWIATAFTYQAEMPVALGWVAVPLLSLYLAIYPALAALSAWLVAGRNGPVLAGVALAGIWIITEWLRGWVFTGFAWDPLGLALLGPFHTPGMARLLPWMGSYALSGLLILIAAGLLFLAMRRQWNGAGLLLGAVVLGMYAPAIQPARDGTLQFTLVQPDIRQEDLNDPSQFEPQFARIAQLSRRRHVGNSGAGNSGTGNSGAGNSGTGNSGTGNGGVGRRLVLWPESGVPDYLRDGYPQRYYQRMTAGGDPAFARGRIGRVIGEGSLLLTGVVDLEIENERAVGAYNSVSAITDKGEIIAGYSKAHLVPFGEYLALRWLLEPLGATRLVAGSIDFIPGPGPRTLDLGEWGQAGMQICYEIVFPGQVVDPGKRPDYIFNPSNDGWFGSWGPPQHLAQARMRAIEEGLPILRSTTTGISAIVDARGVVRDHIGMRRPERMDGYIPPAAAPTLFSRLGNYLSLAWAMAMLVVAVVARAVRSG